MKREGVAPLEMSVSRREWMRRVGAGTFGGLLVGGCGRKPDYWVQAPRPHIFLTAEDRPGARSLKDLREAIQAGKARASWIRIRTLCHEEFAAPPVTARSLFPGRPPVFAEKNNPDYTACRAAGQRILRHALAMHLEEDPRYVRTALAQMEALFDPAIWPDWIDQAHIHFGHPADLRTGMLSQDVAIAFDWLYPFLSDSERAFILEGLDRRGLQPFLQSMEQDPWWAHDMNNWLTVIVGGCGIAGMALGDAHPQSRRLLELSYERMRQYLSIYGAEGEFNESIAYANATRLPVAYFRAYAGHTRGAVNSLAESPFPENGVWTQYLTLPPGRYAAFGDGHVDAAPRVGFLAAIAAAGRDEVLQGFVERHLEASTNPMVLVWYDPSLSTASPEGRLPRGHAFRDNGAQIISRSDWDPVAPEMIVYGKAKRDHNHEHNDVGQVCVDARGERLIVDLGSPSAYPEDFFDEARWDYYNASVRGHNVLMFGGREQRLVPRIRGKKETVDRTAVNGRFLQVEFDEERGGFWQLDLARVYDGVRSVRRTVIHLLPGFVAVLDEAELEDTEPISLRWHTITAPSLMKDGTFLVEGEAVGLSARVISLTDDPGRMRLRRHAYAPPYHLDRAGVPLEQRREPYVEMTLEAPRCRLLSLFALRELADTQRWETTEDGWAISSGAGAVVAQCNEEALSLRDERSGKVITVTL